MIILTVVLLTALATCGWGIGELVLEWCGIVVVPPRRADERGWLFFSKIMLGVWVILGLTILLSGALHSVSYLAWYFTR